MSIDSRVILLPKVLPTCLLSTRMCPVTVFWQEDARKQVVAKQKSEERKFEEKLKLERKHVEEKLDEEMAELVEHIDLGMPDKLVKHDFHLISVEDSTSDWGFYLEPILMVHLHYTRMAQRDLEVARNTMIHKPSPKGNSLAT